MRADTARRMLSRAGYHDRDYTLDGGDSEMVAERLP